MNPAAWISLAGLAVTIAVIAVGLAWRLLMTEIAGLRKQVELQNGRVNRLEAWRQEHERLAREDDRSPPWAASLKVLTDAVQAMREDVSALRQEVRDLKGSAG